MRYVVAHVINSPAGAVRTARLVISDVPDKTPVTDVMQALTDAGRAGEFSEAGVPFGNHEIKIEGRRGWPVSAVSPTRPRWRGRAWSRRR